MTGDVRFAVIGGTGVYDIEGLAGAELVDIATPFGDPSDTIRVGSLDGVRLAFVPRHGGDHGILPGEVPSRANIWALKSLGVRQVLSVSAVGSLRTYIQPRHIVVPSQLIDRTSGRVASFFGRGLVAHISFAEPFCPALSEAAAGAAQAAGANVHRGGTCIVIEGPRFSTRAESNLYRSWDADIIGMTAVPEAQLAREAEMCYAALMAVTDYDTWHEEAETVSAALIAQHLRANAATTRAALAGLAGALPATDACGCGDALAGAFATPFARVPEATKRELAPIIGRYVR